MTAGVEVGRRAEPFAVLAAVSLALLALSAAWALAETRVVEGQAAWAKPGKFALSFAVFAGTLALAAARLSPAWREGRAIRVGAGVMTVAMLVEFAYIIAMAAQGQGSHFNMSTTFHMVMYVIMGLVAALIVLSAGVVGVAVLRDREARFAPEMRMAVGWGFVLTSGLGLLTGAVMSLVGRHVGVHPEAGAVIPFFGWSALVGDLRPAHFMALHAMQAVPLAAFVLGRRGVAVLAVLWTGLTLALLAQALLGMPLVGL
jgi:hypothetical protein